MGSIELFARHRAVVPDKAGHARLPTGMQGATAVDVGGLQRELERAVEGEVRFDKASRALYATDASNFRQPPIGVVVPRSIDDVVEAHRVCREFSAPILNRGCGTSLSGEAVNYAVVIDSSKYLDEIYQIDPERRVARVQPGAINQVVNEMSGEHGLVFGPDPSTHEYCTIGGNLGNNSCGVHSVHARFEGEGSRTSDNVDEMDILTYDGVRMRVGPTSEDELDAIIRAGGRRGEIYAGLRQLGDRYGDLIRDRFVDIPRRVSGYNLDELLREKGFNVARALVGTEGTCVTILEATLKLMPKPPYQTLLLIGYEDIFRAARHLDEVLEFRPVACEAIDHHLYENEVRLGMHPEELSHLPEGRAWLMVELGGESREESDGRARGLMSELQARTDAPLGMSRFDDPAQVRKIWEIRESGLGATAFPPEGGDHWPGWEDSAVDPSRLEPYLRDLSRLYDKYGFVGAMYGHFGDGCVHSRINFDLRTAGGLDRYRAFMEEAADLVVSYGGSLSGEHGDGQQRGELLPRMYGDELMEAFREFKRIWDPEWKMNPGKVVDAYRFDDDLRLGADDNPWRPHTSFTWVDDDDDFAHAALRCVGVGKCRIPSGAGVMCPSFMVLREEKHTTRGRARLLYEMLQGDVIDDGWRSEEVHEALDLCLACKGCTNDCPVNVDIPTYKAEFLHHHWAGRLRPRHAYAFGFIDQVARLGSAMAPVANFFARTPPSSAVLKFLAGSTRQRPIPEFAAGSLQRWFAGRGERNVGGPKVVLWPDTFNNYFHADVGRAAVEALEAAGWHVVMPSGHVCCGRPLYDYGFLDMAERYFRRVIRELRDEIRAGTPMVGIEPSCLATFKDELRKLMPHDDDARRLRANVYHFAEFFEEHDVEVPRLHRKALLWGHCHQKATGGTDADQALLSRMGVEAEEATGGCCGLAGSWGFEEDHYEISMACAEQSLLPAVREADRSTLVVADGFSCKTQVEAGSGRQALHLAEVIKLAREHGAGGPDGGYPETQVERARGSGDGTAPRAAAVSGAVVLAAGWGLRRLVGRATSGR